VYVFPYQKTLEGAGKVAQVIECLLSKHEALSSNTSAQKKKKGERDLGSHKR
jgi:hypothetical protein